MIRLTLRFELTVLAIGLLASPIAAQVPGVALHSIESTSYLPSELSEIEPGEHSWHCMVEVRNDDNIALRCTLQV